MGLPRRDWVWQPHPAHFICAKDCKFFLATCVGDYIVSTVGEYFPDTPVREILAGSRGVTLEGRGDARRADYMAKVGYDDIGAGRKYETMVFPARPREDPAGQCCPFEAADFSEVDFRGYNDPADAARGHMELCEKWALAGDPVAASLAEAAGEGDAAARAAFSD